MVMGLGKLILQWMCVDEWEPEIPNSLTSSAYYHIFIFCEWEKSVTLKTQYSVDAKHRFTYP